MLHHDPVLFSEVESLFQSQKCKKLVIDATLGLGGHAGMLLSHMNAGDMFLGFDRDADNLSLAKEHLAKIQTQANFECIHASFADLDEVLASRGLSEIDFILYDL